MKGSHLHSQSWWSREGGLRFHFFSLQHPVCPFVPEPTRSETKENRVGAAPPRAFNPRRQRWQACWCEHAYKCILTVGCIKQPVYSALSHFSCTLPDLNTLLTVFRQKFACYLNYLLHPFSRPFSNPTLFSGLLVKIFSFSFPHPPSLSSMFITVQPSDCVNSQNCNAISLIHSVPNKAYSNEPVYPILIILCEMKSDG